MKIKFRVSTVDAGPENSGAPFELVQFVATGDEGHSTGQATVKTHEVGAFKAGEVYEVDFGAPLPAEAEEAAEPPASAPTAP